MNHCTHPNRTAYDTYHRASYDVNDCHEQELCAQCARDLTAAGVNILPRGWTPPAPGISGSGAHKHGLTCFPPPRD